MTPADLPIAWREKATEFRRFGAEDQAFTLDNCADDLEEAWLTWQTEPLTLDEAVEESGFTYSSLQKRVASGEIPNVGRPGAPRVQRQDLPRKTPTRRFELETGEPDLVGDILVGSSAGSWSHDG